MTTIMATGDLVLEQTARLSFSELFAQAAPVLKTADVVIGHLEVPHTDAVEVASTDVPATPAPPEALDAVAAAGFTVATLAGNHVYDQGARGIIDTRRHCATRGIAPVGAGANLSEAWAPVRFQVPAPNQPAAPNTPEVRVLSVNCVGPRESWAGTAKAGCAAVEVITHYETRGANPGGPPRVFTFAEPQSLQNFKQQVAEQAGDGVALIVALHKGLVHEPISIADYEFQVARAAIDAGASAVVGHHAHIFKGVEVYAGRPIFHGLGNFVTVTSALSGSAESSPEQQAWAAERQRLFGFVPDPAMPEYPFHPESRHTAIAVLHVDDQGGLSAELIPCWINDDAAPVPYDRAQQVGGYIREITAAAGLDTRFVWNHDRLTLILEDDTR